MRLRSPQAVALPARAHSPGQRAFHLQPDAVTLEARLPTHVAARLFRPWAGADGLARSTIGGRTNAHHVAHDVALDLLIQAPRRTDGDPHPQDVVDRFDPVIAD